MRFVWAIVAILLALWLIGAIINVVGTIIHLLLVIALIIVAVVIFRRGSGQTRR